MFRSWAILGFAMNHLSQWFSDPLITKRLTCSHLLTKGTLSELVRKSEQIFLVYKNQKIWVYRAESKSQGTNYWKCNHKYNKAFLKKKKRKRKKSRCVCDIPGGTWFCSVLGRTVLQLPSLSNLQHRLPGSDDTDLSWWT